MVKSNKDLVASVKLINKQIDIYFGSLLELNRDRMGSKTDASRRQIDERIKSYEGMLKELRRDRDGTLSQIK